MFYKLFATIPLHNTNLCLLQQVRYRNTAVWYESLQLEGGDDQGQRGTLELQQLMAHHTHSYSWLVRDSTQRGGSL